MNTPTRLILAAVGAAVVIALAAFTFLDRDDPVSDGENPVADGTAAEGNGTNASTTDQASAFWEALSKGDRERALSLVDPAVVDSPDPSPFGRAHSLAGQFDWYRSVGWEWRFDRCARETDERVTCEVTATNAWSDALELEPVGGDFLVEFSGAGIVGVTDESGAFTSTWSTDVFSPFAIWVEENHPNDAGAMFNFAVDVDPEILRLYEVNTERFVDAHS